MPKSPMARIHPSTPLHNPLTAGDYRERDILQILGDGLPANFDVFHNLPWSSMHQGHQHFGELDLVVISPLGHILLIEVKAGAIEETTQSLVKTYGGINKDKDIGHQIRRQHSSLKERMNHGDLPKVHVGTLLVLPDVSTHIGQVVQSSTQLASGLADWVPKISHTSNLFIFA